MCPGLRWRRSGPGGVRTGTPSPWPAKRPTACAMLGPVIGLTTGSEWAWEAPSAPGRPKHAATSFESDRRAFRDAGPSGGINRRAKRVTAPLLPCAARPARLRAATAPGIEKAASSPPPSRPAPVDRGTGRAAAPRQALGQHLRGRSLAPPRCLSGGFVQLAEVGPVLDDMDLGSAFS